MKSPKIPSVIKFGTDGWRGVISDNFTFANVGIVAQAISGWVNKHLLPVAGRKRRVAVGHDTRFLSQEYARHVAGVLAANGIEVYLTPEAIPTPALSYGVIRTKSVAGIMITASHNPAKFNGIKIKTSQGGGASRDITDKVEGYLFKESVKSMAFTEGIQQGSIVEHDFKKAYTSFMKHYLDFNRLCQAKFRVIQDVMHGSGRRLLAEILQGSRVHVELMRDDVNPSFDGGKPEPIEEYLAGLIQRMKKERFDLGLVLDGDADRVAAVAPGGEFMNPQKILGLIILHLFKNKGRQGGIVKTLCGTMLIDRIAQKYGLKLYETPVGFKYISDLMVRERIIAGGEEAGGIGVQDYIPERDGILAGLLLVEMMVYEKKNIRQILEAMEREFGRYYYLRADLDVKPGSFDVRRVKAIRRLLNKRVVDVKDYDGVKLVCEDDSWLMLRPSGTEPLVRAYAESLSLKRAQALINLGKRFVQAP